MKIGYEQYSILRNYKKRYLRERLCMNFFLSGGPEIYIVKSIEKWWIFVLLWIPEAILYFFVCLWDGGLKHFELPTRLQTVNYIYPDSANYSFCRDIVGETYEEDN